jgi:methylglutaconyl-CoA hydratase
MPFTTVLVSVEERVATITLNRPDRRNALDDVMIKELNDAVASAGRNPDVRVVVLAGAGEAFCAGMDLHYLRRFAELGNEENLEDARALMRLLQTIYSLRKPVIASVHGPAMGGGCGIVAACDFVIAGKERALLGVPEVHLGFVPALILFFLIRRMGEGRAREFTLRGDVCDAETARSLGLVTEVVDDADLAAHAGAFAQKLCTGTSASSIALTKDLFIRLNQMELQEGLEYAANLNALTRKTEDFRKGIASFLSKEKLRW